MAVRPTPAISSSSGLPKAAPPCPDKLTIPRLRSFAEFVARNLTFVDRVALMGMELMGYARSNLDLLWIDPSDYRAEMRDAALLLQRAGIRTMIFNHPLCLVHPDVQHLAVKSISDWKNGYLPECEPCSRKGDCGGFFVSSDLRHAAVRPYPFPLQPQAGGPMLFTASRP